MTAVVCERVPECAPNQAPERALLERDHFSMVFGGSRGTGELAVVKKAVRRAEVASARKMKREEARLAQENRRRTNSSLHSFWAASHRTHRTTWVYPYDNHEGEKETGETAINVEYRIQLPKLQGTRRRWATADKFHVHVHETRSGKKSLRGTLSQIYANVDGFWLLYLECSLNKTDGTIIVDGISADYLGKEVTNPEVAPKHVCYCATDTPCTSCVH